MNKNLPAQPIIQVSRRGFSIWCFHISHIPETLLTLTKGIPLDVDTSAITRNFSVPYPEGTLFGV